MRFRASCFVFLVITGCLAEGGVVPGPMPTTTPPPASPPPVMESLSEPPDAEIMIQPPYLSLVPSDRQQLIPQLNNESIQPVRWKSDNPEVAVVTRGGMVYALAPGITNIKVTSRGKTGSAYLVVRKETPPIEEPVPSPPPPTPSVTTAPSEPVTCDPRPDTIDPFADAVVSYQPGEGGGLHQDRLPAIVLGPPRGNGNVKAGLDVVSLGLGGEIILSFIDYIPCNGEGPDLIVFENSFSGFFEPAAVSVSPDGVTWYEFPCQRGQPFAGCAGGKAVFANPTRNEIDPTDPATAGGDPYDLADVGLDQARFIKITDINGCIYYRGTDWNAERSHCTESAVPDILGFDLDAVAVVNGKIP